MRCWLLALVLVCGSAWSQPTITDNLITNPSFVGTGGWTVTGSGGNGPCHGTCAGAPNGSYTFSYNLGTVAQTYAINQALAAAGSGVQISGFDYGFTYRFACANSIGGSCENPSGLQDTLNATSTITSNTGAVLYTRYYGLGAANASPYNPEWQTLSTQQRFSSALAPGALGNFSISISGQDAGYWAGNYGPTIKDVYSRAVYTVDPCVADPQSSPSCPGFKTYHTFGDDTWVNVPLQFPFPLYGQVFTNSFMFSNGVVGFMSVGQQPWDSFCCSGEMINNSSTRFNYTIIPLNTDLYPQPQSRFWTQGDTQYQRYVWEDIGEISNGANLNTFRVEIRPTGYIGITYDKVNVNQLTTSAVVGNAALGEHSVNFHGSGFSTATVPGLVEYQTTSGICTSNPLASPQCPGYAQAYFTQQCSANPLYNSACPGYAEAYFTQQCTANPLSNASCPGYATAFLNQQCAANPLFSVDCVGYATATQQCQANPLSASYCPTYQSALSQCQANPLTGTYCPNYQTVSTQCDVNPLSYNYCPAYSTAVNQCQTNPLTASYCPGYQTAQITCAANVLNANYCPGYTAAINLCSSNPLSNNLCSGYQTASTACAANQLTYTYCPQYTVKLAACSTDSQSNVMCPGYKTVTAQESGSTTPTLETAAVPTTESVAIKDSTVAAAISTPSTTSATSVTSVIAASPPTATAASPIAKAVEAVAAAPVITAAKQEEQKNESKKTDAAVAAVEKKAATAPTSGNRSEAARAAAIQRAKELTAEAGKAETLEAQTAVQGAVLGLMNYVPGFAAYQNATVPDVLGAQVTRQYGKPPVDNARSQRLLGGANERLWREMVDSQYK